MTSIHVRRLADRVARTTDRVVAEAQRQGLPPSELGGLRLPWYEVRDSGGGVSSTGAPGDTATIFIFDEIGGSLGVDAGALVQDIEGITAPTIKVRINSPGGSVFDALAIYNALNHHPANIAVYVDGVAASAASLIAMAGDEVVMMPGSQMMIHDASAMQEGNAEDHHKIGVFLDRQSDNVADIYRMRAGGTVEQWRDLMLAETWAFAAESVELHLADRVQAPPQAARLPDDGDELMSRSFDLTRFGYRYANRAAAPTPGTSGHQHRATTEPRPVEPTSRAVAAAARKRAFLDGAPVSMPDQSQRTQTRAATLGLGGDRRLPFGAELRGNLETRNGKELFHVHGYATVFDRPYPMWDTFGEYDEVVTRGAADRTLSAQPDVAFLMNHGGVTMARTTNNTLVLSANTTGLVQDAWLNPDRSDVQILRSAIDDGLITEMSFAFMIPDGGGHWSQDFSTFEIRQFDINRGDVSAVNYGASPWTSIAARAREVLVHAADLPEGMQRAFTAALSGTAFTRRVRQHVREAEPTITAPTGPLGADVKPTREKVPARQGRSIAAVEALRDMDA